MEDSKLTELALQEGFSSAAVVSTKDIVFDPAFRPYCEENLCGQYGANYSCPPDCGSPEQMKQKILAHRRALVLQTVCRAEFTDWPAIRKGKQFHNAAQLRLLETLKSRGCPGFLVGASGCTLCTPCRIREGKPCAFPDLRWSCMSAYCIYVKHLAECCRMEYSLPKGQVAFFGMFVCD